MSETHVHGIDEANMERRTFLKGSMTAAALLGAAGMFGCAVRRMLLSRKG